MRYASPGFYQSGDLQPELGRVARPPVYETVSNADEEPPGYSYHGNSDVPSNRHLNVDIPYGSESFVRGEHSSRSPQVLSNGYTRDGVPSPYIADVDGPSYAADVSLDSQVNASPYSIQDIRGRLSPAEVRIRDAPLANTRLAAGTVYSEQMANQYVSNQMCFAVCR
jgi:hypothetical protein